MKPIIIVGCGRSGTTMLFDMMKAHPGLAPTTGHPDGEDHVGWITHGKAIISGLYGNSDTGDAGHPVGHTCCLHMSESDVTDEARASMHRYYREEVLKGRPGLRVLNKCPHMSNKIGYIHGLFPDAKIIHLIRNPVSMVASWVNIMALVPDLLVYWPDVKYPCLWVLPRNDALKQAELVAREARFYPGGGLYRFADYWAEINANAVELAAECGADMLTVYYEKLIADPIGTLRTITDFCELPAMESLPLQVDKERNSMRRELLTPDDVKEIQRITKDVAMRFGYA